MDSTRLDLDKSLNSDLHLNSHESVNQTPKEEFQTQIFNPRKPSVNEELSLLVDKWKREKEKNKKLKESLVLMCEQYNSLQSQMMDYLLSNKADEQGVADVPFAAPNKQKSESIHDINNDVNQGKSQNCSSDDGSCNKRIKEDIKAKISRMYATTNASETSLVQKSAKSRSILAATYEGKNNHQDPSQAETAMGSDAGPALVAEKHSKQLRRSARIQAQQQATQANPDPARL